MATKTYPLKKSAAGRKPTAPAPKVGPQFVGETLPEDAAKEAQHNQQIAKVGELLPAGFHYVQDEMVDKAARHLRNGAIEWLEMGRCLLIIKEHEAHGAFKSIVEERLQLEYRGAARAMQAAARYLGGSLDTAKVTTLSLLPQSKMLELLVLDDDELEALTEGGSVADLNLDKIERMSVRELRKELHKSKEKAEVDGERAGKREQEISELTAQLSEARRAIKVAKPDELGKQMLLELAGHVLDARQAISRCITAVDQILVHGSDNGAEYSDEVALRSTELANAAIEFLSSLRIAGIDGPADHTVKILGD